MKDLQERYQATLIGTAIGDTLGMPVEGWNRNQIKRFVGRVTEPLSPDEVRDQALKIAGEEEAKKLKFYGKGLNKGDWTDDTALTLAIAESIAAKKDIDFNDIARKHVEAYKNHKIPAGFGPSTIRAIEKLAQGVKPSESGDAFGPGNGPAMKMAPVGLWMDASLEWNRGMWSANMIGRMTHLDPRSVASGEYQASYILQLLNSNSRQDFVDGLIEVPRSFSYLLTGQAVATLVDEEKYEVVTKPEDGFLKTRLEWIQQNADVDPEEAFKTLGASSLVYKSYPFALFMFQKYFDDPIEGLLETVNFGGDCDTTGAIYGSLAGARHGMVFPKEWVEVLDQKDRLIKAADGIYNLKKGLK